MVDFEKVEDNELASENEQRLEALIALVELDEDLLLAARLSFEYYEDLPYHNLNHALTVAENSLEMAQDEKLTKNEKKILLLAALWHDASYGVPLQEAEVSKEHRSARLAYDAITMTANEGELMLTSIFAQEVQTTILATNVDSEINTKLARILNTADLANLHSDDKMIMLKETGALFIEKLYLERRSALAENVTTLEESMDGLEDWIFGQKEFVERLIQRKLDPHGLPALKALANIKFISRENLLQFFSKK